MEMTKIQAAMLGFLQDTGNTIEYNFNGETGLLEISDLDAGDKYEIPHNSEGDFRQGLL